MIRTPGRLDPNCAAHPLYVLPPIRLLEDEDENDRDQRHTRHDQTVLIDFSLYDVNAVPEEPRQSVGQKLSLRPRTDISAFLKMLKNPFSLDNPHHDERSEEWWSLGGSNS